MGPKTQRVCSQSEVFCSYSILRVVVVVALSLHAWIWGECSIIHSLPALFFFFFFEVEISARTLIPLFYARISPQSLRGLR